MKVEWTDEALDQLADIFVAASPSAREAIEQRVLQVNSKLAVDPWELGESRASLYWRAWFNAPLLIIFELVPADGVVVVQSVNRFGMKSE